MKTEKIVVLVISQEPEKFGFENILYLEGKLGNIYTVSVTQLEEGLDVIKNQVIHLVILDWELMGNISHFSRFKKNVFHTPVLVFANGLSEELALNILSKGAQDVLRNPLNSKKEYGEKIYFTLERFRAFETRRWLDQKIFQAQNMDTTKSISGEVAETLNGFLQGTLFNAKIVKEKLPNDHPALDNINKIESFSDKSIKLSKEILSLTSGNGKKPGKQELSEILINMKSMMESTLLKNIFINYDFCPKDLWVNVDIPQIRNLILCLIKNSAEAIGEEGGKIEIRTSEILIDKNEVVILNDGTELVKGDYGCISIQDTGPGIKSELENKVLEPFFTTKISARGLGLSIVQGTVQAHKGVLEINSKEGKETKISVYLPLVSV